MDLLINLILALSVAFIMGFLACKVLGWCVCFNPEGFDDTPSYPMRRMKFYNLNNKVTRMGTKDFNRPFSLNLRTQKETPY